MNETPNTYTVRIDPDGTMSQAVHDALSALAEAIAADTDEVAGFGQRHSLNIGIERLGPGSSGLPVEQGIFCIGYSIDTDDNSSSCTIRIP